MRCWGWKSHKQRYLCRAGLHPVSTQFLRKPYSNLFEKYFYLFRNVVGVKCTSEQTRGKMQTEGEMQTEDCRPGVKCRLGSKRTCFPGKTSRVSWIKAV